MCEPTPSLKAPRKRFNRTSTFINSSSKEQTKTFLCEYCGKSFGKHYTLTVHLRVHTGEKPYRCSICCSNFTYYQQLQVHLLDHTGEKPFKCQLCPSAFKRQAELRKHKAHHKDQFQCYHCQKFFSTTSALKSHMQTNSRETPFMTGNPYVCSVCPLIFKYSDELTEHAKLHSSDQYDSLTAHFTNQFQCHTCALKFTKKISLEHHMYIHTFETETTCPICSEYFWSWDEMQVHAILEHNVNHQRNINDKNQSERETKINVNYINTEEQRYCDTSNLNTSDDFQDTCSICSKDFENWDVHVTRVHDVNQERTDYQKIIKGHKQVKKKTDIDIQVSEQTSTDTSSEDSSEEQTKNSRSELTKMDTIHQIFADKIRLRPRKNHFEDKRYKCLHCSDTFSGIIHLNQHLKTHLRVKLHKRGITCSTDLHQLHSSLRKLESYPEIIVKSVNIENPQCSVCKKMFRDHAALNSHLAVQHKQPLVNDKPITGDLSAVTPKGHFELYCLLCGMIFYKRSTLWNHLLSHDVLEFFLLEI